MVHYPSDRVVRQIVSDLKHDDVKDSDINIDSIVDYIYEDSADYFGTNNLIFTDENGERIE